MKVLGNEPKLQSGEELGPVGSILMQLIAPIRNTAWPVQASKISRREPNGTLGPAHMTRGQS